MPELPEVETMVRDLQSHLTDARIVRAAADYPGSVVWPDFIEFRRRVSDRTIRAVGRRGKYAHALLSSGDLLVIHRGMSGSLLLRDADDPPARHLRLWLDLEDGRQLRFHDQRKFGKIWVMRADESERPLPWARMGPEPLDPGFAPDVLTAALARRTAPIKPLLLNQNIVAGLGNIYVDEALFEAGIHPLRRAHTLTSGEIAQLHAAIKGVLGAAVARRGTTFQSYVDLDGRPGRNADALRVFHRQGRPCPRCATLIERLVVGGRGTHVCPSCQPM